MTSLKPLTSQIDRKQRFFSVTDLHFPHWERIDDPLGETILDGELVIDIDPKTHAVGSLSETDIRNPGRTRYGVAGRPLELKLELELELEMAADCVQESLRFYAFDCLVLNGENIMSKPLVKRYAVSPFHRSQLSSTLRLLFSNRCDVIW
jgi:mRNA guanylyltransferase